MTITEVFGLLGGLALFLYGMQMMSSGLEDAAGNRMKAILEKLTSNRFMGVGVGAVITAIIQSSSATTVMVVGFVNSGMMTLKQAVWIIMGANIGTTITGQLVALDIGMLAPVFAFIGVAMIVFVKNPKAHFIGQILAGFGVLFIGMDMMGAAMKPLQSNESFISLMTTFSNPAIGILAGAVFTAVIQSSSASVGILQKLAAESLIPLSSAVFVLFGMNIGTCITAVLAAIGTNRSAKRTTLIHLMFNLIGTAVFTVLFLLLPVTKWIIPLAPGNPAAQIAHTHTLFNIATTLLLLPFGTLLAWLATRILPDKPEESAPARPLEQLLHEYRSSRLNLGNAAIHTDALRQEVERMLALAAGNIRQCYQAVLDTDADAVAKAEETEELIDLINKDVSEYVSHILITAGNGMDVQAIEGYFTISANAERIGDHAVNIADYVAVLQRKGIVFSQMARSEIMEMQQIASAAMAKILHPQTASPAWMQAVADLEQQIDDMTDQYREKHLQRMRKGECTAEACVLYSEMLTDFERIGDHVLNIAQAYAKMGA